MSESSAGSSEPQPTRRRLDFSFILSPWFQRSILAVVVSSVISFLMIDYVRGPNLELEEGEVAQHDIRATQNIEFGDPKATRENQDEAERHVRPVYDLNLAAGEDTVRRMRLAFESVRELIQSTTEANAKSDGAEDGAEGSAASEDAEADGGSERGKAGADGATTGSGAVSSQAADRAIARDGKEAERAGTRARGKAGKARGASQSAGKGGDVPGPVARGSGSSISTGTSGKNAKVSGSNPPLAAGGSPEGDGASGKGESAVTLAPAEKDPLAILNTSEKRREFNRALDAEILDVFYQNLVFLRFDEGIEDAICSVVKQVMSVTSVLSKSSLPDDMTLNGITVIALGRSRNGERLLHDRDQVLDMDDVRRNASLLIAERYSDLPKFQQDTIEAVVNSVIKPTLSYNAKETTIRQRRARASVQPVTYHVKKGTMVVRAGDPIDSKHLLFLNALAQAKADFHPVRVFLSTALLVLIILVTVFVFASSYIRKVSTDMRDLITASIILVFVVALTRVAIEISNALAAYIPAIPLESYYYAIPLACGAMVVRILMNSETALLYTVVASLLAAMLVDYSALFFAYYFVSSLAAAGGIAHTKERVHVLRGGLVAASCNVAAVVAIHFIQTNMIDSNLTSGDGALTFHMVLGFVGGLASAILSLGVVPFFEMFGYVTDYKLLELANLNHPLLKELMVRAPGTYHHSVIVGALSEAAAQEIRANALLARVGCYYHDIGKMRKPEHFIENLRDVSQNKHDRLPPHMSALIISGHVRDGIEMARRHRLPQPIIDLIPQHHGTALISFFLNKARRIATANEPIDESLYRYPGPKPQTREAGIVMLADATEASTRSIKQVNPAKIRLNLQKILQRVMADGQLDECPLTLKDLATIMDSFHKTLLGIYHNRIEYPPEFQGGTAGFGEGTGAVLTLETDDVEGLPARPMSDVVRRAGAAGLTRTAEIMATTTADPLPIPAHGADEAVDKDAKDASESDERAMPVEEASPKTGASVDS